MAEDKCPCIISDGKNCIDCGAPVDDPVVTTAQLAEVGVVPGPPLPDDAPLPTDPKENIPGLINLAKNTAREFQKRLKRNMDPTDPALPRLRMVGFQMLRVPHRDVWRQLIKQSFEQAKEMGFRGNLQRWADLVNEPPASNTRI